jgi:hypothetical protein
VVAGVGAVELVVGAHHRVRPTLLDGCFEGSQIDFPEGPVVHPAVPVHTLIFLVVGGKMLYAGGDSGALLSSDKGGGQLP